jgi:hypothetical protein
MVIWKDLRNVHTYDILSNHQCSFGVVYAAEDCFTGEQFLCSVLPNAVSRAVGIEVRDPLFRCLRPECGMVTCRDCLLPEHEGISCYGS